MEAFFVEFTQSVSSDHAEFILVNPKEVIAVTQSKIDSGFVSLRLSNGHYLTVTGVRAEVIDKLGIVVRDTLQINYAPMDGQSVKKVASL